MANSEEILAQNKITCIVNAAADFCESPFQNKIKYLKLNLRDNSNEVSCKIYSRI